MKAKDTVMSQEQQLIAFKKGYNHREGYNWYKGRQKLAEAQAGISFTAGAKEVVEFINQYPNESGAEFINGEIVGTFKPVLLREEWEAKLKEWGIELLSRQKFQSL